TAASSASPGSPLSVTNLFDETALSILSLLCNSTASREDPQIGGWLDSVAHRLDDDNNATVVEYLVVLALLRQSTLGAPAPVVIDRHRCATALSKMRFALLGERVVECGVEAGRLPRRYLAKQTHDVQVLHTALFRRQERKFVSAALNLYVEYSPRAQDAVALAVITVLAVTDAGLQIVLGFAHGYVINTFAEHCLHKYLGHASKERQAKMARVLARFGTIGQRLYRYAAATSFSHGTVHHASYAANYVDRFAPRDTASPSLDVADARTSIKRRIDKMVGERTASEANDIVASGYGTSLAHPLQDVAVLAPFSSLLTIATSTSVNACGGHLTLLFGAVSLLTSLSFLALSHYLHPYLHMRRAEAFQRAGALMRMLLKSRYVSHVAQAHYLHHQDVSVNQNLALGADFLLGYRMSSVRLILRLRSLGAFY
ncbi:MAG: hypothetical protein ABIS27_13695, partial [Longimicrobiales bacterium]